MGIQDTSTPIFNALSHVPHLEILDLSRILIIFR